MSAKVETAIWLALKSRIESLPLACAKAWPGQVFNAPSTNNKPLPYLRIGRVSAAPTRQVLADGMPHDRKGFLIITLVYPLGQDVSAYDQIAATIAEHFSDGVLMSHGSVEVFVPSYPSVSEGYEDNGYWTVPVRIAWRCFA